MAGAEQTTNPHPNTGEALRHAIDLVEARTAEATELRIRLEITEKAESTLRAELVEEHRRREEAAERERDESSGSAREATRRLPSQWARKREPFTSEERPQELSEPRSW